MKKHLKALLVGAAVAGSILACTAAYARFSDSVTVTNHISVGDINISLRELEKKDGREMKYQDRRIVLPGDEISKIPRITNHSEPCWVRVKISYTDDLEGLDGLDDRNLTGMSPRWIRKGEYFYYTRKLEQGDSVDIFAGVTVPSQWMNPTRIRSWGSPSWQMLSRRQFCTGFPCYVTLGKSEDLKMYPRYRWSCSSEKKVRWI